MATRTIVVNIDEDLADIVTDRMWQWGVQAVSETGIGDGRVEIATSVGNDDAAIARALASLPREWPVEVRTVDDSVGHVAPEFLSPTWYAPGMVSVPAVLMPFEPEPPAALVTVIDPGSAFGLGDHPTTRSAMAMLARLVAEATPPVSNVLDVGCGSGALAVLAAQLGVTTIRAIDIADAAVEATLRNMHLNAVTGHIEVDTTPLGDIDGLYDLVLANILAPVLIDLADDLERVLRPGGTLVISGILAQRHDHVLTALAPLTPVDSIEDEGWITIAMR
jgi:ribosomal protein L11 methyltransferase